MASPWTHYVSMIPGPEEWGPWQSATQALVLAIGRQCIPDSERYIVGRTEKQLQGQSANLLRTYIDIELPMGKPNADIATSSMWLLRRLPSIHLFMQWEVAVAMGPNFWEWADRITVIWPSTDPRATFNGRDVAIFSKDFGFCNPDHPHAPIVLTHSWYLARAMLMTEKVIGRHTCASPQSITGWDRLSVQWWTASTPGWCLREIPGRIRCLGKYV